VQLLVFPYQREDATCANQQRVDPRARLGDQPERSPPPASTSSSVCSLRRISSPSKVLAISLASPGAVARPRTAPAAVVRITWTPPAASRVATANPSPSRHSATWRAAVPRITTGSRVPSSAVHNRIPPSRSALATAPPSTVVASATISEPCGAVTGGGGGPGGAGAGVGAGGGIGGAETGADAESAPQAVTSKQSQNRIS